MKENPSVLDYINRHIERLTAVILMVTGAVLVTIAGVAAVGAVPVTDYANYPAPEHGVPDGCDTERLAQDLTNPVFHNSSTGETSPWTGDPISGGLRSLRIARGQAFAFTWDGLADGSPCDGATISLSVKRAYSPAYDPATNQHTVDNAETTVSVGASGSVMLGIAETYNVPGEGQQPLTCYQLDASIGSPLAVVGPAGSYYSINGTLISAQNGNFTGSSCEPVVVEEPSTPETTDPEGDEEAPEATIPPSTTEATIPPSTTGTTVLYVSSVPVQAAGECAYDEDVARYRDTATGQFCSPRCAEQDTLDAGVGGEYRCTLAATGSSTAGLALTGVVLLVAGGLIVLATWRRTVSR